MIRLESCFQNEDFTFLPSAGFNNNSQKQRENGEENGRKSLEKKDKFGKRKFLKKLLNNYNVLRGKVQTINAFLPF